jgi:hypothetical protein
MGRCISHEDVDVTLGQGGSIHMIGCKIVLVKSENRRNRVRREPNINNVVNSQPNNSTNHRKFMERRRADRRQK